MSNGDAVLTILIVLIFVLIGLFFYFLPSRVGKNKKNANAIFCVNLLFGWSAIGWIVALIWALKDSDDPNKGTG